MAISSHFALFLVFMSGIGYSLQSLILKIMAEEGFQGSFQVILVRGFVQVAITGFIMLDKYLLAPSDMMGSMPGVFGDSKKTAILLWARGLLGFGGISLAFLSLEYIPIADSIVLLMMSPFYAALLSCLFLGEPWLFVEYIAAILSLIGVVFVSRPPTILRLLSLSEDRSNMSDEEMGDIRFGLLCALLAGFCAGCSYSIIRVLGTSSKMPWPNIAFVQGLCQALLALPGMYLAGQRISFGISSKLWSMIFLAALLGSCSQFSMTIGMQHEKSARASIMRMSDIIGGFTWQILFTHDRVTIYSVIGALLISTGVVIVVIFKGKSSNLDDEDGSAISKLMKKVEMQVAADSSRSQKYSQLHHDDDDIMDQSESGNALLDADNDDDDNDDDISELCMTDGELSLLEKLEKGHIGD